MHTLGAAARWTRRLGLVLMAAGALSVAWGIVVWQWQDPFTALYTLYKQDELSHAYAQRVRQFREPHALTAAHTARARRTISAAMRSDSARALLNAEELGIRAEARAYRLQSHEGEPLGRIIVPRLSLNMIFVDGTSESSLAQGPGRDLQTYMPGEKRLVYIAGHRTTFLAPFSHIDALRRGDVITLQLPYATFVYRVTRHIIVPANDLAVLRPGDRELLVLQACHPRFFATHRYIVYARPVRVIPAPGTGSPYVPR